MKHLPTRLPLLSFLFASLLLARLGGAEPLKPTDNDKEISVAVSKMLEHQHVTRHPLDETMSQRLFRRYLETFDPRKMYFLESDIKELAAQEKQLDELMLEGNIDFAYAAYKRFLQRQDACVGWATEFAHAPYDFAAEDQIPLDVDELPWPKDEAEAKARWHSWIKYEILSQTLSGEKEDAARARIEKRYQRLARESHNYKDDDLLEFYLDAFTSSFDPHSQYMGAKTLEDFNIQMRLSLEGIGATLSTEEGLCVVKEIVPGGAADRDGRLKPGDKIVGVGQGDSGDMVDTVEMRLRDAVTLIRGKSGSRVRLEIQRDGATERTVIALTRQRIELKDHGARGEIVDAPAETGGTPLHIGIVHLPSFYADDPLPGQKGRPDKSATEDVRRILKDFVAKKVDGVIMDLSTNGGGLLPEAICVTGLFLDQGPVVRVKDPKGKIETYDDEEPGMVWGGPLLVSVSRLTASASEIFAGAIQDYKRGIIVGDSQTHGKGTVQKIEDLDQWIPLADGSSAGALKITIQQFYRPGGDSTQNRGVAADVVLPRWTDNDVFGETKLPYALAFDKVPPAQFAPAGMVTPEQIARVRELSGMRLVTRDDLRALAAIKKTDGERRARKVLTFSEASLKAEKAQAQEEAKRIEEVASETTSAAKEPVFGTTPYTRELLAILTDLIRVQHEGGGK